MSRTCHLFTLSFVNAGICRRSAGPSGVADRLVSELLENPCLRQWQTSRGRQITCAPWHTYNELTTTHYDLPALWDWHDEPPRVTVSHMQMCGFQKLNAQRVKRWFDDNFSPIRTILQQTHVLMNLFFRVCFWMLIRIFLSYVIFNVTIRFIQRERVSMTCTRQFHINYTDFVTTGNHLIQWMLSTISRPQVQYK